jgi:hypothetical protein
MKPSRRAKRRLADKMVSYENQLKSSKSGGKEFTKPGAAKAH